MRKPDPSYEAPGGQPIAASLAILACVGMTGWLYGALNTAAVWDRIKGFPDAVLAGLITAAVALIAVVINNTVSRWNLNTQHKNDRRQKQDDVLLQTRRDVYMDVAMAIEEALSSIIKLTSPSLTDDEATAAYDAVSAKIGRTLIVASEETSLAVVGFMEQLEGATNRLQLGRRAARQTHLQIEWLDAEAKRLFQRAVEIRESDIPKYKDTQINPDWVSSRDRIKELLSQEGLHAGAQTLAQTDLRRQKMELYRAALQEHQQLRLLLLPILVAARNDLGTPIDVTRLKRAFESPVTFTPEQMREWFNIPTDEADSAETK